MVAPGIGARLDRDEAVAPLLVCQHAPLAGEVRIERCIMLISRMDIAAASVGLPDLDERARHGAPILVEHPAGDDNALPKRCAPVLAGEIIIGRAQYAAVPGGPGNLRETVRESDWLLPRGTLHRAGIGRMQRGWLRPRFFPSILRQVDH
jgi:hypothetical protein